jgi:hypothetical protein
MLPLLALTPLVQSLFKGGLSLLGNAILSKGKDYVEKELDIKLPDEDKPLSTPQLLGLRQAEFRHEEILQQLANDRVKSEIEAEKSAQLEVTHRWQADMLSDSWLSKNIRPLVLIFLLSAYMVFSVASAFGVTITQAYVELLAQMLMLVMGAYFAGRTIEKIVDMKERGK